MPFVRVELDIASFNRLAEIAVAELRPIAWQAEVLLRQALETPERPPSRQPALEQPPQVEATHAQG